MSDETAPNEGTVPEVLDNVGDDPDAAAAALEAEQSAESPRTTLVEKLEPLADEAVPTGSAGDVETWVGEDVDRAKRALEAENAGQQRKGLTAFLEGVVAANEDEDETADADADPDPDEPETESESEPEPASTEDSARSEHDPYAPGGRAPVGPTDDMQRG